MAQWEKSARGGPQDRRTEIGGAHRVSASRIQQPGGIVCPYLEARGVRWGLTWAWTWTAWRTAERPHGRAGRRGREVWARARARAAQRKFEGGIRRGQGTWMQMQMRVRAWSPRTRRWTKEDRGRGAETSKVRTGRSRTAALGSREHDYMGADGCTQGACHGRSGTGGIACHRLHVDFRDVFRSAWQYTVTLRDDGQASRHAGRRAGGRALPFAF
ncbi:hypothetical protein DENSPDRAFT_459911 [Dentipellis sp. KUC8613]|nr:hypothetical protein DENSPDRAFT_459911 [Dentipellis sp. KUC8613]